MYQIVHATTGLLIGSQTGSACLAFILGLISHFVLDAIPHDSLELKQWKDKSEFTKKFALEAVIDLWLFAGLLLIGQQYKVANLNWPMVVAIVGALLPDYVWGLPLFFGVENKYLEKFKIFHEKMHVLVYQKEYLPLKYAVPIQIIFLLIILGIYLLLITHISLF